MCHIAKATCMVCYEVQTVRVEQDPTPANPNATSFISDEFHLPCEKAKLTHTECGRLRTCRFSVKVPSAICKKCQAYHGKGHYRDWLKEDVLRRARIDEFLDYAKLEHTNTWQRLFS